MSRAAQAHPRPIFGGPGLRLAAMAGMLCAATFLSACGAGGFSLKQADVDRSLYTSNVPVSQTPYDAERLSDEATIRNAVTSADIETLAGAPLPWANAQTGARGQVSNLAESRQSGVVELVDSIP
ncbi:MAG: RT0821/Lpp0805 family surface protein, partial [Hyphomicrobiales bacterium]|nr:RT0821/Lpp0805 family surface protein [Hyphomicrobiales bacterium]